MSLVKCRGGSAVTRPSLVRHSCHSSGALNSQKRTDSPLHSAHFWSLLRMSQIFAKSEKPRFYDLAKFLINFYSIFCTFSQIMISFPWQLMPRWLASSVLEAFFSISLKLWSAAPLSWWRYRLFRTFWTPFFNLFVDGTENMITRPSELTTIWTPFFPGQRRRTQEN